MDGVDGELKNQIALSIRTQRRAGDPDDESHHVVDADVVACDAGLLRLDEQRPAGLARRTRNTSVPT
jgi:hypothetical protein